jgi:acyl carrier protein
MNGKLDDGALPQPSAANLLPGQPGLTVDGTDGAGAEGSVEHQVGEIVRVLLELPAVDPEANIFLLGGHSMLAMQLVSRVQQVFGVKLTLRQVFGAPTVSEIAAAVGRRMPADRTEASS